MKTMITLYIILLFTVNLPEYQFKSTSSYISVTQASSNAQDNNSYTPSTPKPKKVSGIGGWIDWLTWGQFNGVPSSASNEDMYAYYNYVHSGGTLSYDAWYNYAHNQVPIGSPLIPFILLTFPYILYKAKKAKRNLDK